MFMGYPPSQLGADNCSNLLCPPDDTLEIFIVWTNAGTN
jgi:hypothetical protein